MRHGETKVESTKTRNFKPASESVGLSSPFSAPTFLTIMIGLLAFASPIIAAEITSESAVHSAANLAWMAKWFLVLPIVVLIGLSLVVNKRQGWGWVIVGLMVVVVLLVLQLIWSVITSMGGDPADDENYFTPVENWTSDSFDD